eukprot:TRINITY_DN3087_c0_g1_i13.p1 TRINITY_DN3087_c0_g1~~TRINITY_DN3087_c0_g1_i13.p1  ORF type:complete len:115 (+),score=20.71 TRINITY_DN3087_c0_g1_i13:1205-1549(+)
MKLMTSGIMKVSSCSWDTPVDAFIEVYCDYSRKESLRMLLIPIQDLPFNHPIQHTFPVNRGCNRGTITLSFFYQTYTEQELNDGSKLIPKGFIFLSTRFKKQKKKKKKKKSTLR